MPHISLSAVNLEPDSDPLFPSLSAPPLLACSISKINIKKNKLFIYFERERECTWVRGRGGGRESQAGSVCTISVEPDAGLELTNHEIMT